MIDPTKPFNHIASDVAEIFCWFYANIVPELNGFNLPSCAEVEIVD